jgi:FRG domain
VNNWAEFKDFAYSLDPDRYIFRGQERAVWRLRTSFHRAGRANLERFLSEDVPRLHKHLSARTTHVFNMRNPEEHGAFVSLAQHHGYPTPLLDWTRSAFVGAYFAYRKLRNSVAIKASPDQKVRIFVFDRDGWGGEVIQISRLAPAVPHLSFLDALAIENTRMIPQQALSTITNVDDIESYIRHFEHNRKKSYLQVIDLPARERPDVMKDLFQMGITAGSIFPGLDGACEALKEQYFPLA